MRKESWQGCIWARDQGIARSVGISTFGVRQMKELLEDVPGEVPAVNQVSLLFRFSEVWGVVG
jgi:2,5-diketo-D-gluconate reductase A